MISRIMYPKILNKTIRISRKSRNIIKNLVVVSYLLYQNNRSTKHNGYNNMCFFKRVLTKIEQINIPFLFLKLVLLIYVQLLSK